MIKRFMFSLLLTAVAINIPCTTIHAGPKKAVARTASNSADSAEAHGGTSFLLKTAKGIFWIGLAAGAVAIAIPLNICKSVISSESVCTMLDSSKGIIGSIMSRISSLIETKKDDSQSTDSLQIKNEQLICALECKNECHEQMSGCLDEGAKKVGRFIGPSAETITRECKREEVRCTGDCPRGCYLKDSHVAHCAAECFKTKISARPLGIPTDEEVKTLRTTCQDQCIERYFPQ